MESLDILPSPVLLDGAGAGGSVLKLSWLGTPTVEGRGLADTNPLNSEFIPRRSEEAEEEEEVGAGAGVGTEARERPRRSDSRLLLTSVGAATTGAGAGA